MLRASALIIALVAGANALPASARDPDEPAASREPDAQDVAMTPLTDLNLRKDAIPAVLVAAVVNPYESAGFAGCPAIEAAIADLDTVLGPDMDVAATGTDRLSTGRMAKSVVASFIPFRGILRELSGAAEQERGYRAAIYAGAVRRGFLKGLGQQKGCDYPARPAFTRVAVSPPTRAAAKTGKAVSVTSPADETAFVSQPVVQTVPPSRP